MLVCSVLIYAVGKGVFGRSAYAMMAKATTAGGARTLSGATGLALHGGFLPPSRSSRSCRTSAWS